MYPDPCPICNDHCSWECPLCNPLADQYIHPDDAPVQQQEEMPIMDDEYPF